MVPVVNVSALRYYKKDRNIKITLAPSDVLLKNPNFQGRCG